MNQKERMLAGLPYKAWMDGLAKERTANQDRIYEYNQLRPSQFQKREEMLKEILGKAGKNICIEQPFHCDYGCNIEIGDNFFGNYHLVILDVAKVTIGNNVMCGPNVGIYTAGHPVHPQSRNSGYEYGIPVVIKNNVWIGANAVINPGVTIGDNVVVASGSIVTKDVPDNAVVGGNPAKILRMITEKDRKYYFKDREFDVDDY